MSHFIFDSYGFDPQSGEAYFRYCFDDGRKFEERILFQDAQESYDEGALQRALKLAFFVAGTTYFKTFPTSRVVTGEHLIDQWQADFLNQVYGEGLSQFAYENNLSRDDLAHFTASGEQPEMTAAEYEGGGVLSLQSGGKDSLLVARRLQQAGRQFSGWYVGSSNKHPKVLDDLDAPLSLVRRSIDMDGLRLALEDDGKNGHVPITYILQSFAIIQAILLGENTVLVAIAHEGEEPHAQIGDLPVTHQWSKTWHAEQLFAEYVQRYVSADIKIGSPLRHLSELRVAELFVEHAWDRYGHEFSSCNVANYRQGIDNSKLSWCGACPKCANAYLLFAPFLPAEELQGIFNGRDLFTSQQLTETFKGLLEIDGVMKPFECIGEIAELRYAYHVAQSKPGYARLPFDVPESSFDYRAEHPSQDWARLYA